MFHVNVSHSQTITEKEAIEIQTFDANVLNKAIIIELNKFRESQKLDTFEISSTLEKAANELVLNFADEQPVKKKKKKKIDNPIAPILINNGGSGYGFDFTIKKSTRSADGTYTYEGISTDIVMTWCIRSNSEKLLADPKHLLVGVSSSISKNGRYIYLSVIIGSYLSENNGVNSISQLPYTLPNIKSKLLPYDAKECRKIDRIENLQTWYEGVTESKGEFIFNHPNIKKLSSLNTKNSGLAIDIILPEQYLSQAQNLIDYSKANRGVLTKTMTGKKIMKKNALSKTTKTELSVSLGGVPTLPTQNYETNLLVIQNNHVCASLAPSFVVETSGKYARTLHILADTITVNNEFNYTPYPDSTLLSFRIPFDKRKYTYKTKDIEPFLKLLNEPDFIVYEIQISAFSSIEGVMQENDMLQQKRAESIVEALKTRQKEDIISQIETKACWEQFQSDILKTKHNVLASMSMKEAQDYIRQYDLNRELEPILKNHRYAQIDLRITYDITGEKEQKYVLKQFHKALYAKNLPLALSIQKYIMKSIINGHYPLNIIQQQQVPWDKPFAGLLMNNLYMSIISDDAGLDQYEQQIRELHNLDPRNEYILYNNILMRVLNTTFIDANLIEKTQNQIQSLYYKTFTKETVDALNMKFQFMVIRSCDSIQNGDRIKLAAMERIKEIVDVRDESSENIMRLANVFIEEKDYDFALTILESFVENPTVEEQLLFTWLSLCSFSPDKMLTRKFARVVKKAFDLNKEWALELFDGKHFSYRVFENPEVKKLYMENCGKPSLSKN